MSYIVIGICLFVTFLAGAIIWYAAKQLDFYMDGLDNLDMYD